MGNGSAVLEVGFLYDFYLALGGWHRSKDKKPTSYGNSPSFMMNKKWVLVEQFNLHLMRFQQVSVSSVDQSEACVMILGWIADAGSSIPSRRGRGAT